MKARRRETPARPPCIVGLVGGIGSGKSAVAEGLRRLGAVVLDADRMAHAALRAPAVVRALRRRWGPEVLGPGGIPDRARVARQVFGHPAELRFLEGLLHPRVRRGMLDAIRRARRRQSPWALVLDAPLLFEAGLHRLCDAVVHVHAPVRLRLQRVRRTRGWSGAELSRRERRLLPLKEKRRRADKILVNATSRADLFRQIHSWVKTLRVPQPR